MREPTIEALRLSINKSLVPQSGGSAWAAKADTRRSLIVIHLKHRHFDLRGERTLRHVMTLEGALKVPYKFDQATGDFVCDPITIESIHDAYLAARKPRCDHHLAWKKSQKNKVVA